jgi:hypothetical protein
VEGAAVLLGVISETSFALGLLRFLVVHIWLWEKKGSRTKIPSAPSFGYPTFDRWFATSSDQSAGGNKWG